MSYEEQRVRVRVYGQLLRSDPRVVEFQPGMFLHRAAAELLGKLINEALPVLGGKLRVVSALRPHRWRSREHYEARLIERYGSVKEGRKWLAYSSPHETGLAVDFGSHGLWPTRKTAAAQRKSHAHRWLVDHAWRFGWHPYKKEPWHWECPIPLEVFADPSKVLEVAP